MTKMILPTLRACFRSRRDSGSRVPGVGAAVSSSPVTFTLLLSAAALGGCAGDLENPDRFGSGSADGGMFVCDPVALLSSSNAPAAGASGELRGCAAAGCHDSTTASQGLDFTGADLATTLAGQTSGTCMSKPMLVPGDATASYIIEKIEGSPECGSAMPLLSRPFNQAEMDCLRDWINTMPAR